MEGTRDQATQYMNLLLQKFDGSPAENFHLLRQISVTVAGDKIYRESIVGKEQVDEQMLKYYLERVEIDIIIYKDSIAANLTADMMKFSNYGSVKKLTKKQAEARAKAVAKAAKKKVVLSDIGVFTSEECGKLYKAIKSESLNVYNTYWHMTLNKDHSIPSGKQLVELLNAMRQMTFDKKDVQRIIYLKANRLKVKIKKENMKGPTEATEETLVPPNESDSENDEDGGLSSEIDAGKEDGSESENEKESVVIVNREVNIFHDTFHLYFH